MESNGDYSNIYMSNAVNDAIEEILGNDDYSTGLISSYGAGDVEWWADYIRSEIRNCNDYWRNILESWLIEKG